MTESGIYLLEGITSKVANLPAGAEQFGVLVVFAPRGDRCVQLYALANSAGLHVRMCWGMWFPWNKLV